MSTLSNWLPSRSTIRDYELLDNIVDNPSVSIQKCRSKKFNSIIAMKRIKSVASAINSDWITETITEILRNRYHHNIVNLLDYFIDGRDLCLIMEYLPGAKSLRYLADENARVRVDRLPVLSTSEITLVAIELIDALAYLHSRELPQSMLFHGELKPENVLVSRERIKDGTEFDKVITMSAKFKILTIPSSLVSYDSSINTASPQDSNYCAPEVLLTKETNRSRGYSSKSDIWALGATLLNLATSFSISRSDLVVLHRYQNRSWCFEEDVLLKFSDAQRMLWDQQSSWIQDIVCSCLQLHPEQRFTARQLQGMPTYQALFSLCSVAKEDVNLLITENHRLVECMQIKGECPVTIKSEDSGKYETLSNRKMPAAPEVARDDDGDHDSTRSNCSSDEEEEKVQVIYSRQTENVVADNNANKEPVKYVAPIRLNSSSYDNEVRTLAERSLASVSIDNSSVAPIDGLVSDMDIARNLARPASTRGSFGSVYSLTSGFSSIGVLDTSATSTGLPKNSSLRDLRELNNGSPLNFANVLDPATPRVEPVVAEVVPTQRSIDSVSKRILQGHSHYIACIAVLPDDRIVSGSYDHTIKIWNPNTGECEMTLFGHSSYVYCLTVLPNGRVVSGSWDTTLKIWNVTTGECEQTLSGHSSFVCWVVYLPDLKRIVSGDYKKLVRVWQCDDGKTFQFNRIATLPYSQCVSMFSNGETIQFQGTNLVSASPAASAVSSGSSASSEVGIEQGRRISPRLGDSATVSPRLPVNSPPPVPLPAAAATAAAAETKSSFTPPLASSGTVIPTPTYSRMRSESLISAGIASTPGSANKGQLLVHAYRLCSPNGNVKCSFEGHLRPITQAIRLGTNLVTSSADRTLRVWDGDSGACLAVLMGHGNEVNAVACGRNGVVVSGSNDNSVRLWDTTRYAESKRAQRYSFRHNATMASDQVLLGHQHFVSCIAVLSDGRIVSGSFDKTIIIWSGLEDALCTTKENAFCASFCLTASEDDREGLDDGGIPLPPVTSFQSDVPLPPFPNASFEI